MLRQRDHERAALKPRLAALAAESISRREPAGGIDFEADVMIVRVADPLAGDVFEAGNRFRGNRCLAVTSVAKNPG